MDVDPRRRVGLPLYLVGFVILGLGAVHVVVDADPLYAELAEASILVVFGVATGTVGYRLRRRDATLKASLRVTQFVLGAALGVGLLAAVFVATRLLTGEPEPEWVFVLSIGWSVGAAAGAWTGFYVVQLEGTLEAQRDLAKRLTVLQRVLRHNLRNEMTVIVGATRYLHDEVDDPAVSTKLETIDRHARAVTKLSEQSQTLTRIWRTDGDATVDLGEVLGDEVERFRSEHPDVGLDADVPGTVRVRAHPKIGLAVREALENAVTHNDAVSVGLAVREAEDGSVVVEVTDDGSGIPQSELRPLWATGEGPLSHTTGLGLWMIYWLVESSGGGLDVESGSDGTTLEMTLRPA